MKTHVMDDGTSKPDGEVPTSDLENDMQINDNTAERRERKKIPAEKGRQENIRILKNRRTVALAPRGFEEKNETSLKRRKFASS